MLKFYSKKIEERLNKMHETHSYEEMGKNLNISSSNIAAMLNGTRPIKSPSVDLLLKVFPKCKIDLHGEGADSCIPKEKVEEIKINAKKEARENFRKNAIMAVLAIESLPSDAAVEVMKALKDL